VPEVSKQLLATRSDPLNPSSSSSSSSSSTTTTTLIVADAHDLVRNCTRSILEREPDLRVIGEAKDGQEALELCRSHHPELVLMDISMPRMDGLQATKLIKEEFPEIKVLIVSSYDSPGIISEARRVGGDGYFLKGSDLEELLEAVRAMHQGEPQKPPGFREGIS
jgi:DNA-binding NarL/FixJ family response regulator